MSRKTVLPADPDVRTGHPTSVRIPEDLLRDLDQEAAAQRRHRSFVIVEVLRAWQKSRARKRATEETA